MIDFNEFKTRLMAKLPVYVDRIPIYSPLLINIAEIGQKQYENHIGNCIITKDQLKEKIDDSKQDYDALLHLFLKYKEYGFISDFLQSLFYFTKLNFIPYFVDGDLLFTSEEVILSRDNYLNFVEAIKYVNCIGADKVENIEEMDEFDRRVAEMEKKIKEAQSQSDGENITFIDLISSVANMDGNDLNILNIWELNFFTFREQFQRGQLKENQRIATQQRLAGASAEEVTVESYIKNIK